MPTTDPAVRITELADRIIAADEAYATETPLMTDAEYDELTAELADLLERHPDLTPARNPLEEIWQPATIKRPVRHLRPMLSLQENRACRPAVGGVRVHGRDVPWRRGLDDGEARRDLLLAGVPRRRARARRNAR